MDEGSDHHNSHEEEVSHVNGRRESSQSPNPPPEEDINYEDEAPLIQEAREEEDIERDQVEVDVEDPAQPTTSTRYRRMPEKYQDFERMPTVAAASISIFFSLVMITTVFLVPCLCVDYHNDDDQQGNIPHQKCPIQAFSVIIYVHVVYWFSHLIIDPYLKLKHKRNRMMGYLYFYKETKNIRRAPFYLVSFGNFALLLSSTILDDFCEAYPGSCGRRFFKIEWLRGLITVECLFNITFFFYYIRMVREFNSTEPFPDCMDNDIMDALGTNLVLKFPGPDEPECTEEEETYNSGECEAQLRRQAENHAYVFGSTWKEEDRYVKIMQAEMIGFLITQVKRKNRKVVTLSKHLARFTNDVQGLVGRPIEP